MAVVPRLKGQLRLIAYRLAEDRVVSNVELVHALWSDNSDGGPLDASRRISQYVYALRGALTAVGITIITVGKQGWRIAAEDVEPLRTFLANEIATHAPWSPREVREWRARVFTSGVPARTPDAASREIGSPMP